MKSAVLRTLLLLWLPGLAALLAGLPALLTTGQVDPAHWTWLALALAFPAWLAARSGRTWAAWMSVGALASIALLAWLAAGRMPDPAGMARLAAVTALATAGGIILRHSRCGVAFLAAAALLCWLPLRLSPMPNAAAKPALHIISALPLFWSESPTGLASRVDAPIIAVLRRDFDIRPLDSPPSDLGASPRLLVAQPRALAPHELVNLDGLVRRGGRAVILADPFLRWPSSLALGDRRRAPSISLLQPLLSHWGVRLEPQGQGEAEQRHFLADGRVLTLYEASRFVSMGPACRIEEDGLIARCRVGKGSAVLVADADLIDDRLWLSDPARPLDERQWTADTPQFIAEALGATAQSDRQWVRSGDALMMALRWAVILGIFWAGLGSALFARLQARPPARPRPLDLGNKG